MQYDIVRFGIRKTFLYIFLCIVRLRCCFFSEEFIIFSKESSAQSNVFNSFFTMPHSKSPPPRILNPCSIFSVKKCFAKKRKMFSLPKVLYIISVLNSISKHFKNLHSDENWIIKNADFSRTDISIILAF